MCVSVCVWSVHMCMACSRVHGMCTCVCTYVSPLRFTLPKRLCLLAGQHRDGRGRVLISSFPVLTADQLQVARKQVAGQ